MTSDESAQAAAPDLAGEWYQSVLRRLHEVLQPKSYLEIGVDKGDTLGLASCDTIGVDPAFCIQSPATLAQSSLHLYRMTSDAFFREHSPTTIFGRPIDMAFLDGMHRCEFLLRDFANTQRHCRRNSVVLLHDCLPVEVGMTDRVIGGGRDRIVAEHRKGWWTGDVWRTALLLKRRRPEMRMLPLDASGTGLIALTNLSPDDTELQENHFRHVEEMMSWDLNSLGIERYFDEIGVMSTAELVQPHDITARLWL